MTPFALATIPHVTPSFGVAIEVLGLAVLCTALAYLLYFALIRNVGPVRTLSVTFLIPVYGIVWGAMFLGEAISPSLIAGLLLILISVALVADVQLMRNQRSKADVPSLK
jgi:drug/metabolite transporter (DMT)-like permease